MWVYSWMGGGGGYRMQPTLEGMTNNFGQTPSQLLKVGLKDVVCLGIGVGWRYRSCNFRQTPTQLFTMGLKGVGYP